jgi:hypothetical protein
VGDGGSVGRLGVNFSTSDLTKDTGKSEVEGLAQDKVVIYKENFGEEIERSYSVGRKKLWSAIRPRTVKLGGSGGSDREYISSI